MEIFNARNLGTKFRLNYSPRDRNHADRFHPHILARTDAAGQAFTTSRRDTHLSCSHTSASPWNSSYSQLAALRTLTQNKKKKEKENTRKKSNINENSWSSKNLSFSYKLLAPAQFNSAFKFKSGVMCLLGWSDIFCIFRVRKLLSKVRGKCDRKKSHRLAV